MTSRTSVRLSGTPADTDENYTGLLLCYEPAFGDIEPNRCPQLGNVSQNLENFDSDWELSSESLGSEDYEIDDSTPPKARSFRR